jgi:hypothetical protein
MKKKPWPIYLIAIFNALMMNSYLNPWRNFDPANTQYDENRFLLVAVLAIIVHSVFVAQLRRWAVIISAIFFALIGIQRIVMVSFEYLSGHIQPFPFNITVPLFTLSYPLIAYYLLRPSFLKNSREYREQIKSKKKQKDLEKNLLK